MSEPSDQKPVHLHSADTVDEFRPGLIAAAGAIAVMAILITLFVVQNIFVFVTEDEINAKQLSLPSKELETQRAAEKQTLTSYKFIDQTKGVVQLPVDLAMQLVVKDYTGRRRAASATPAEGHTSGVDSSTAPQGAAGGTEGVPASPSPASAPATISPAAHDNGAHTPAEEGKKP